MLLICGGLTALTALIDSLLLPFHLVALSQSDSGLSDMAKEDNGKCEAKRSLEKVLAHFQRLSWSPATAMRMYPAASLKTYE